jgi:hypothetical protein
MVSLDGPPPRAHTTHETAATMDITVRRGPQQVIGWPIVF